MKKIIINSPLIKDKKEIIRYSNEYNYVPKSMKNYFDGEISILIINSNYRGIGIGKKLLLEIFKKAKQDGMKNIQILSDESCNYYFYEYLGCKKVYETTIHNGEPDKDGKSHNEKGFIYEKKFNDKELYNKL